MMMSKVNNTFPVLNERPTVDAHRYQTQQMPLVDVTALTSEKLVACIAILLHRYTEQDNVLVAFDNTVIKFDFQHKSTLQDVFDVASIVASPTDIPAISFSSTVPGEYGSLLFDMQFYGTEDHLMIRYNQDLYSTDYMSALTTAFSAVVQAALLDEQTEFMKIPLAATIKQDNASVSCEFDSLVAMLNQYADVKTPCLKTATAYCSHQELHDAANQFSHYLMAQNVTAGATVGIYFERGIDMVVAILAVLKAGAAYLPLDPKYPLSRNVAIVRDCVPALIIGQKIPEELDVATIVYDLKIVADYPTSLPDVAIKPSDPAYILYTSGSTGKPKGIIIEHHSVVNLLQWAKQEYTSDDLTCVLFATSICFDLSIFELFVPLATGHEIVLLENIFDLENTKYDNISLINTVPSAMQLLLKQQSLPTSVRTIILAGEMFNPALANQLHALSHVQKIYNCYGPSEATTYVCCFLLPTRIEASLIPIGHAILGNRVWLVDEADNDIPIGMPGEIVIQGEAVMRGYLNHQLQIQPYKTGDYGYYNNHGEIVFIGRRDSQIKRHGYRIELQDIETVLVNAPGVSVAAVLLMDFEHDQKLVAFVEAESEVSKLEQFAKQHLPSFMVPTLWRVMSALPRLPNGKVDKNHLVQSNVNSDTQQIIETIWTKLLQHSDFTVTDNFFDVGGHSLLLYSLIAELEQAFDRTFTRLDILSHPCVADLSAFIDTGSDYFIPESSKRKKTDLAIIGIGVRLPDASSPDEFWNNIAQGKSSVQSLSRDESNPDNYVSAVSPVANIEYFDHDFFNMSLREAQRLDPQQRLILECCWHALEDAGHASLAKQRIAVFSAIEMSQYLQNNLQKLLNESSAVEAFQIRIANDKDYVASRVAYKLNLSGPAVGIQTACSSSLVALHMAKQSLQNNECDMAIVCAASLHIPQLQGYVHQEGMVTSKDGICRAYDEDANGTVFGNGACAVLLSPATVNSANVYAVIKGSAINNDGSKKVSYAAPSTLGQVAVIQQAQQEANIFGDTIELVEGHGTGTVLGDAVELDALSTVFREHIQTSQTCALGSIKTNIGHLDSAAGLAGLIKAALAIKHRQIPASLNFKTPNQQLDASPFYIATEIKSWQQTDHPRHAAVSSFGIGGTNAHVILAEPDSVSRHADAKQFIFVVSAKTSDALVNLIKQYIIWLPANPSVNLANLCFTSQVGRAHFAFRLALQISSHRDLLQMLQDYLKGNLRNNSNDICQRYMNGETINWQLLYDAKNSASRINLPTYCYDKQYCWIDSQAIQSKNTSLLGKRMQLPLSDEVRFENKFSAMFPVYNQDHRLFSTIVVPGSLHVALFISAILKVSATNVCELIDINFIDPFILQDNEQRLIQVILSAGAPRNIKLVSLDDDQWRVHSQAIVAAENSSQSLGGLSFSIVQQRCSKKYSGDYFYQHIWVPGNDTGQSLHWLHEIWVGSGESLARLQQPAIAYCDDETVQTGLIEAGLQLLNACWDPLLSEQLEYIYVPYNITRLSLDLNKLQSATAFWAYTKIHQHAVVSDTITADVYLMNESGKVLMEICNFKVRKLYKTKVQQSKDVADAYVLDWQIYQTPIVEIPNDINLKKIQRDTVIFWQKDFQAIDDDQFWIDLTKTINQDIFEINHKVCDNFRALLCELDLQHKIPHVKIVFLVSQATMLAYSGLLGYLRSAVKEFPELNTIYAKVDTLSIEAIRQINSVDGVTEIRIENNKMYTPKLLKTNSSKKEPLRIVSHASYVITGGAGSLGQVMLSWLIAKGAKKIIVIDKSESPPINYPGVNVVHYNVDVADESAVADIDFTYVKGVIHCAGVLLDVSISNQTSADLTDVMLPKIKGAMNLHKMTKQFLLDFFINFSSVSSIIGVAGQTNYAAANAFLDEFVNYRNQLRLPCLTVNWGLWKHSTMQRQTKSEKSLVKAMDPKSAMHVLEHCYQRNGQIIITNIEQQKQIQPIQIATDLSVLEKLQLITHQVLGSNIASTEINLDQGLVELGLDSLMAIDYHHLVQTTFNISVSATFAFDYPTLRRASAYIETHLDEVKSTPNKRHKIHEKYNELKTMLEATND